MSASNIAATSAPASVAAAKERPGIPAILHEWVITTDHKKLGVMYIVSGLLFFVVSGLMAALIRFASLNPYWYVPTDLAAERIAPNVLKEGLPYLKHQGYQVMTDWNDSSTIIDPSTIDWKGVADGTTQVHVRQLPGRANAMGVMKFMFPNSQGVYLHDTPQKELLTEASRMFSGGCVRLEDAPRLGRWLFGREIKGTSSETEHRVDLAQPVPVYITYFTVVPEGSQLATYPDVYGRDKERLAAVGSPVMAAR